MPRVELLNPREFPVICLVFRKEPCPESGKHFPLFMEINVPIVSMERERLFPILAKSYDRTGPKKG